MPLTVREDYRWGAPRERGETTSLSIFASNTRNNYRIDDSCGEKVVTELRLFFYCLLLIPIYTFILLFYPRNTRKRRDSKKKNKKIIKLTSLEILRVLNISWLTIIKKCIKKKEVATPKMSARNFWEFCRNSLRISRTGFLSEELRKKRKKIAKIVDVNIYVGKESVAIFSQSQ